MRRLACLFVWIVAWAASPVGAAPPSLIADLSSNHIDLTTGFSGTRLLLFGATESTGDVIVVIRGPVSREVVRRKERIAGIWVNRRAVAFETVPGFYFDAATKPLREVASEETLRELRIGPSRLALPAVDGDSDAKPEEYREALLRLKTDAGLYNSSPEPVTVMRDRLFRVEITFPANVPTGPYQVEVYLFRQGKQIAVDRKELSVRRAGAEAAIYNFAHDHSAMYGIIAIVVALFAGWLAGAIFRKV